MHRHRSHIRNASWLVFAITAVVYFFSVERVGSLWDVGEFILGAHKLQVVHPPGAPLFLVVGRLFVWFAELISDNPSDIAFAVNLLSGLCTAFAALFVAQVTGILGKLALVGRDAETTPAEGIAVGMAALVGGLATAFATSIWFSAVEGEVYAMSTLFTAMTTWAMVKWYDLPDTPRADRWIIFAVFATGLSVGVHLLSLLTFPALAMFYFYKKYPGGTPAATAAGSIVAFAIAALSAIVALVAIGESAFSLLFFGLTAAGFAYLGVQGFKPVRDAVVTRTVGGLAAAVVGTAVLVFAQAVIIKGLPALWSKLEILMVNGLGMPFHSGLLPLTLLIGGLLFAGFYLAHTRRSRAIELATMAAMMLVVGFSVVGVVVLRANASTPINMNAPTDAMRLQYYLNREQYGDRPLLYGPHFEAKPNGYDYEDVYGMVDGGYEVVDQKISYTYASRDKILFPRMADVSLGRPGMYRNYWMDGDKGKISLSDNLKFFVRYQLDWMYWRYFMWNFAGRQNHDQGYQDYDPRTGNWITGIDFVDEVILGVELDELPAEDREDEGRNTYFAVPFLLGLLGAVFHLRRRPEDFVAVLALFVITGIGIVLYTNQPPSEPRERDYVQAGAVFVYCVWIGMAVLAIFDLLRTRIANAGIAPAAAAGLLALSAPALMAFQGMDDHSRLHHTASRDYAANFLHSLAPDAILFTYGDNDTYPLWYAQEVEGIRPDVRVINLSLIAVDWYINLLRRKINESEAINLTIPPQKIRGGLRNQILVRPRKQPMSLQQALAYVAEDHELTTQGRTFATDFPTSRLFVPVSPEAARAANVVDDLPDSAQIQRVDISLEGKNSIIKDELAVLDIIGSNAWERPIYFAVTVPQAKMLGLQDYLRLEGMALRLTPFKSPSQSQYGMVGAGRVDVDRVYENITEKFTWGNFDEEDTFVDPSYAPSVQSTQLILTRTMLALMQAGDTERAGELAKLYFEAYPHMNFKFSNISITPMQVLAQTGNVEEAKEHLRTLAASMGDKLEFLASQDQEDLAQGTYLGQEMAITQQTVRQAQQVAAALGDPAFLEEVSTLAGVPTPQTQAPPAVPTS